MSPPDSTRASRISSGLLPPAVYVVVAVALFSSAWVNPTYVSAGLSGDSQIYMWMLAWVPFSIGHGLNPLFTDYLIYPQGANLFWSLIPILPGLLLAPVFTWVSPVVAFNLAMTLALATSAWSAYAALNALVRDRLGAFLGGLLFGFSPYMLAHSLGHPNLVICAAPPLALLILAELLVWQRRRAWVTGLALGLLGVAQLLTTPEILLTTGLAGAIGILALVALRPREAIGHLRHAVIGGVVATIVFAPAAVVVLGFAFLGPQVVHGVVREQDIFVTDVMNFVVPTHVMLVAPSPLVKLGGVWTGDDAEWNAYVGVPLLGLLGFIAARWWSVLLVRWSAIVAVAAALLSLGPHLHLAGRIHFHIPLPWLILQPLPLFDNVLPSRLMLFFYLLAAVALAFFVSQIRRHLAGWKLYAAWAWVVVSFAVLLPAVPWPVTPNPVPAFFAGSAVQRIPAGTTALIAPFTTAPGFQPGPGEDSATYPMLWQLMAGMRYRMPSGALNVPDTSGLPSGGRPPQSQTQSTMIAIQEGGPAPGMTAGLRAALTADLRRWQVKTVIVGPMYNQRAMVDFFTAFLDREPEHVDGVYVWWNVGA